MEAAERTARQKEAAEKQKQAISFSAGSSVKLAETEGRPFRTA